MTRARTVERVVAMRLASGTHPGMALQVEIARMYGVPLPLVVFWRSRHAERELRLPYRVEGGRDRV